MRQRYGNIDSLSLNSQQSPDKISYRRLNKYNLTQNEVLMQAEEEKESLKNQSLSDQSSVSANQYYDEGISENDLTKNKVGRVFLTFSD